MNNYFTSEVYFENRNQTFVEDIEFTPARNRDVVGNIMYVINAIAALNQHIEQRFIQMMQEYPQDRLTLVVTIENAFTLRTLVNERRWGPNRRFNSLQDIRDNLPQALDRALENLQQSDNDYDLHELTVSIRIYRNYRANAQGRIKAYIKKTINSSEHTQGLYQYQHADTMCGFKAIIYHLTVHMQHLTEVINECFKWLPDSFALDCVLWNIQNVQAKKRFNILSKTLATGMECEAPFDWVVTGNGLSTALKFVTLYPQFQIFIFNEPTRQVLEHRRGSEFRVDNHPEAFTICMSYSAGHLILIRGLFMYFGKAWQIGNVFCYECGKIQTRQQHNCTAAIQCKCCFMKFSSEDDLKSHKKGMPQICGKCSKTFMNQACKDYHFCRASHVSTCQECGAKIFPSIHHNCGSYHCLSCRQRVGQGHECQMLRPDYPDPDIRVEEEGANYYAFDLESLLIPHGEAREHVVNLVVVRQVFNDREWIFHSLNDFIIWLETLKEESHFFAHNMKGYDGRMVFEYLIDRFTPPQSVTWNGSKIMQMQYGKIHFRDTLLHLPASLAQLPKMMGLDENKYKKGFFPYLFNTPENQDYVGPLPSQQYFDPDTMKPKKREEFEKWHREYAQQIGNQYTFKKELIEYCQSDVQILAETIKAYMTQQMSRYPLNPLSVMTIASYAMSLYKLYHMPDDCFYRLSILEDQRIRQSMHGGRTDTRRMLKEWSDDEIQRGYYGKYQDVQSLYPTVQFYDPLPIGKPDYLTWGPDAIIDNDELKKLFGFVCCDIVCEKPLFHPIIVHTSDSGRLIADMNPKHKIVIATPELHLALDHGYRVTRLYWAYRFHWSTELFKTYFQDFLKDKLEASGIPKWVTTEEDWKEFRKYHLDHLEIELNRENMIANASRKTGAKLLCNSLWGKFGERMHMHGWKICEIGKDDGEIMALEKQWIDGNVDLTYRRFNRHNTHLAMAYKWACNNNTENMSKQHLGRVNIALASMVTSHARCRLWKELHKLGERVLYHDTDSIIYEHQPNAYNIPEGRYLGEWEDETGGDPIIKFVSTGPKCYSYMVRQANGQIKESTKVKGITLNSINADRVNYDTMKKLVVGDISEVETQCLTFKYDKQNGTMFTRNAIKLLKQVYEKGEIDESTWVVYPFGYRELLQRTQATTM